MARKKNVIEQTDSSVKSERVVIEEKNSGVDLSAIEENALPAALLALTPSKQLVSIKIFPKNYCSAVENHGEESSFVEFCDKSIDEAIKLKSLIELGVCNVQRHPDVDDDPNIDPLYHNHIIQQHININEANTLIRCENHLIELNRVIVHALQVHEGEKNVYMTTLNEIIRLLQYFVRPYMLTKNPEIVRNMENLCRYVDSSKKDQRLHSSGNLSGEACDLQIQQYAKYIMNLIKKIMNFNGSNIEFMLRFADEVKLFDELTANLSPIEKRQLISDPVDGMLQKYYSRS